MIVTRDFPMLANDGTKMPYIHSGYTIASSFHVSVLLFVTKYERKLARCGWQSSTSCTFYSIIDLALVSLLAKDKAL